MKESNEEKFFDNLSSLDVGQKATLKRECGKMLNEANSSAFSLFYRIFPFRDEYVKYNVEDKYFFIACLFCLFSNQNNGNKSIEEAIGECMKNKDSESLLKRVNRLFDTKWSADGYLAIMIYRLVHFLERKGFAIDCKSLLKDLLQWDYSSKQAQKRWARCIYIKNVVEKEN